MNISFKPQNNIKSLITVFNIQLLHVIHRKDFIAHDNFFVQKIDLIYLFNLKVIKNFEIHFYILLFNC